MGKEARLKEIRKQLRNVVKENIEEVVKKELVLSAMSEVKESATAQLVAISTEIRAKLEGIDNRSKDFQSFIMRQALDKVNPPAEGAEVVETPEDSTPAA